jgi:tight adherence protein C
MNAPSIIQFAFLASVFIATVLLVAGVIFLFRRSDASQRLQQITAPSMPGSAPRSESTWVESVEKVVRPLARLSVPDDGWEESELRRRFMHAGLRSPSAPWVFFGLKTLLCFGLPILFWLTKTVAGWELQFSATIFLSTFLLAAGYYVPNLILNRLIRERQREIFDSFPDALDLLTICVEAGLGLDAAISKVAQEMRLKSPILADEMELVTLEMRAGAGKERALRNLSVRTGVEDIDTLVAMLIQSEKFGTSVGESLRIHSDMLRTKRQQRAEEAAAKIAVKLVFPLVLCIFPSILITVAGPAVIQIGKAFSAVFGGS